VTTAQVRDGHTMYQLSAGTAYRIARLVARNIDLSSIATYAPEKWAKHYGMNERRWITFESRVINCYGIGPQCIFAAVMGNQIIELLEAQNGAVVRYRAQNLFEDSIDAEWSER